MTPRIKKIIKRTAKILLVLYVAVGLLLYFGQDLFLFHPVAIKKEAAFHFSLPYTELNLPVANENLNIVCFKTTTAPKGLILFFHGNMQNVEHYDWYAQFLTKHDYEVWMIDYPGYGKSTGKISETILYEEAMMFYKEATKKYSADNITIYGKSLGTGIAAYVAANEPCKQLILETPYYSLPKLGAGYFPIYPISFFAKYNIPTYQYIQKGNEKISLLHGTSDEVIPYDHAVSLKNIKPEAALFTIKNGRHNNLRNFPEFLSALDSLLANPY